jgi:hypothetical protein
MLRPEPRCPDRTTSRSRNWPGSAMRRPPAGSAWAATSATDTLRLERGRGFGQPGQRQVGHARKSRLSAFGRNRLRSRASSRTCSLAGSVHHVIGPGGEGGKPFFGRACVCGQRDHRNVAGASGSCRSRCNTSSPDMSGRPRSSSIEVGLLLNAQGSGRLRHRWQAAAHRTPPPGGPAGRSGSLATSSTMRIRTLIFTAAVQLPLSDGFQTAAKKVKKSFPFPANRHIPVRSRSSDGKICGKCSTKLRNCSPFGHLGGLRRMTRCFPRFPDRDRRESGRRARSRLGPGLSGRSSGFPDAGRPMGGCLLRCARPTLHRTAGGPVGPARRRGDGLDLTEGWR